MEKRGRQEGITTEQAKGRTALATLAAEPPACE